MSESTSSSLEARITQLETKLERFKLRDDVLGGGDGFSAGSCTNGCTDACTHSCTNGCTDGSCAQ